MDEGTDVWEVIQGTGTRVEKVRLWRGQLIGAFIEVGALNYGVSSTDTSEKGTELSVQTVRSWDIHLVPQWLRVFLGVLLPSVFVAPVREGLEAEKQREVRWVLGRECCR